MIHPIVLVEHARVGRAHGTYERTLVGQSIGFERHAPLQEVEAEVRICTVFLGPSTAAAQAPGHEEHGADETRLDRAPTVLGSCPSLGGPTKSDRSSNSSRQGRSMKIAEVRRWFLSLRVLALATCVTGLARSAAADQIVTFEFVGVTYAGSVPVNGIFTYNFTTHHWATCSFLGGLINGNPLISPVTITTSSISGDYSTQTTSYNFEFVLNSPLTATTGSPISIDPPGTPVNSLSSFFVIDDGLGNPTSVVTYPITSGSIVNAGNSAFGTVVCAADNAYWSCPCSNNTNSYSGCRNSVNAVGASLENSGLPQVSADQARLDVTGMPPSTVCLFFQGTSFASPALAFGDGLRCATGSIVRLGTVGAVNGTASYPGPNDPALHLTGSIPGAGGVRTYQAWYRNAAAYCTSATFNLSNGLEVSWTP
jgi:hypothetical protein